MSMSSYIENSPNSTVEFDKKASWRIGLEGEFILPNATYTAKQSPGSEAEKCHRLMK